MPDIHDLVQADVQSLRPTTRPALATLRARSRRRHQRHWTVAAVGTAAAVSAIVALTVGGPRQTAPPARDTQPITLLPGQSLLSYGVCRYPYRHRGRRTPGRVARRVVTSPTWKGTRSSWRVWSSTSTQVT